MNVFEDLVDELKEENLLEETIIESSLESERDTSSIGHAVESETQKNDEESDFEKRSYDETEIAADEYLESSSENYEAQTHLETSAALKIKEEPEEASDCAKEVLCRLD